MGRQLQDRAEDVARSAERGRAPLGSLASSKVGLRRRRNVVDVLGLDPLDHGAVGLHDHGEREAEEDRAGVHELAEELAVGVEEHLGAVEVGRHQLRLAGERPALHLAIGIARSRPCWS